MMLLTNMGEFEAFVSLGNMLQRSYFAPFIAMDVPAMSLRWRCVCVLLQREIPILNAHFISLQFSIDSCLMNWWKPHNPHSFFIYLQGPFQTGFTHYSWRILVLMSARSCGIDFYLRAKFPCIVAALQPFGACARTFLLKDCREFPRSFKTLPSLWQGQILKLLMPDSRVWIIRL